MHVLRAVPHSSISYNAEAQTSMLIALACIVGAFNPRRGDPLVKSKRLVLDMQGVPRSHSLDAPHMIPYM